MIYLFNMSGIEMPWGRIEKERTLMANEEYVSEGSKAVCMEISL